MSRATYLVGDVFDRLREIPDGSVDLVVTSPPFLALRSYLPADHPDKHKEIGSETTPAAFLNTMLALTAEWRRVLAPHGSICVELGDSYSGGTAEGTDARNEAAGMPTKYAGRSSGCTIPKSGGGWPLDKSLAGIPTLYAWSLAYGRNLLAPDTTCAPWRVRNLLVWARPNPPVGALGDKWRPATSYVTVACVGRSRYFDLDAVRTEYKPQSGAATLVSSKMRTDPEYAGRKSGVGAKSYMDGAGAPPLDWCDERDVAWQPLLPLATQPYAGSHYATFPTQLPKRLIECMCPQRVCTICGKPSERIAETTNATGVGFNQGRRTEAQRAGGISTKGSDCAERVTLGWTDCGHDAWRPGLVLDPFGGSGTTAVAATGLGRDCLLIDIDARNADLARERVGMFLEVQW